MNSFGPVEIGLIAAIIIAIICFILFLVALKSNSNLHMRKHLKKNVLKIKNK